MKSAEKVVERYIAIWNETDAAARRAAITETWTSDATYVDPMMRGAGGAGIDAMIAGAQAQFPGFRFRQTGNVDAHNDRLRFSWLLGPGEDGAVVGGTDFAELAEDGRLAAVTGFIDFAPGM